MSDAQSTGAASLLATFRWFPCISAISLMKQGGFTTNYANYVSGGSPMYGPRTVRVLRLLRLPGRPAGETRVRLCRNTHVPYGTASTNDEHASYSAQVLIETWACDVIWDVSFFFVPFTVQVSHHKNTTEWLNHLVSDFGQCQCCREASLKIVA